MARRPLARLHAHPLPRLERLRRRVPDPPAARIEILEPGCRRLRVAPHPTPFPYRSVFSLPKGAVTVQWDGERATINAPDGVVVEEEAPVG